MSKRKSDVPSLNGYPRTILSSFTGRYSSPKLKSQSSYECKHFKLNFKLCIIPSLMGLRNEKWNLETKTQVLNYEKVKWWILNFTWMLRLNF